MRFLVTGATGFIGAQVVKALLKRNHQVVAISSQPQAVSEAGVEWIQADLLSSSAVAYAVEAAAAEGLIHCAWDTTPGTYWTTTANLTWTAASLNLVSAFQRCGGKRLVVMGTSAEYSWDTAESLTETGSRILPQALYGVCKNSLREIVEKWAPAQGVSWAWGRVFCPFGPEEKAARLIPKIIKRLLTEDQLKFDSGCLIRDFLSVVDLGDACAALAESSLEGPVNVASGRDMSIRALVTQIATELGHLDKVKFDLLPDPTSEPLRIVGDITRLRDELGWHPSASLEVRLAETCRWWQARLT
jgi:nucleoside-diphosphate-sugar epimerase